MPVTHRDMMDVLPEEVILQVISYLDAVDLIHLQLVSHRYLILARDDAIWKIACFNRSRAEAQRLRTAALEIQDPNLTTLHDAVQAITATSEDLISASGSDHVQRSQQLLQSRESNARSRALANWEPGYPDEYINYYEEYIQRHAAIHASELRLPGGNGVDEQNHREATGLAVLNTSTGKHAIAPLDDGRICIWDIHARSTNDNGGAGQIMSQSEPGMLSRTAPSATEQSHAIMTESGAVECVSIDHNAQKAYFAVQSFLHEVDLHTLQLTSSKQYPFPIMALSAIAPGAPLTVGTNMTVHLHDPRDPAFGSEPDAASGEMIGGSRYSHVTLEQPGPLSILNDAGLGANDHSIWVAGRFTSLLNYDRRFFPRLRGTVFSGARIASLASIPYAFVPRGEDLLHDPSVTIGTYQSRRSEPGTTIIAAAEYKGKGSLELHGVPNRKLYQNRQTTSATKLLSVAPHRGRIVFSDGNGDVKWFERDGFSHVRTININNLLRESNRDQASGLFHATDAESIGDIVQKLIPVEHGSVSTGRHDITQSSIAVWTGEGRLAVLGFGHEAPLGGDGEWHDALEEQAQTVQERALRDAERQHSMAMRRALERNADEVRFVRGLGLGMRPP